MPRLSNPNYLKWNVENWKTSKPRLINSTKVEQALNVHQNLTRRKKSLQFVQLILKFDRWSMHPNYNWILPKIINKLIQWFMMWKTVRYWAFSMEKSKQFVHGFNHNAKNLLVHFIWHFSERHKFSNLKRRKFFRYVQQN